MNVKDIRRKNLRMLAKEVGGITALAKKLNKSQSQISHVIGTTPVKNIGDKFAKEIETLFNKPSGWLDHDTDSNMISKPDNFKQSIYWIPILSSQQIDSWLKQPTAFNDILDSFIPITAHASEQAFAINLNELSHQLQNQFKEPSFVIVDPMKYSENNELVVVKNHTSQSYRLTKLMDEPTEGIVGTAIQIHFNLK